MDIKRFTNESPGKLVPVETKWGPDHAFIPDPLPPAWDFPHHLWPLLADAKEQVALLEGIGRGLANPNILLQPLSGQEAIQSSALEGTFATPEQMLLFELDPKQPRSEDDPVNVVKEVANYRAALKHGLESELPLSLRLIRNMHRVLLTGVRGRDQSPGQFRRLQVGIGIKARFVPPPPQHILDCLAPLEKYFHIKSSSFDPLVDCFLAHYQFETIHPFNDGNGRVGRLLLAIMLQHKCRLTKPWLYMSDFFNRNREEYVQYLFDVSAKCDWASWIEFCLQGTIEQAKATLTKCDRLRQIKADYMQRLQDISGATRLIQIIDRIFESPVLRISDVRERLDVSDPTARSDTQRLVEADILQEIPDTWPKVFYAHEVLRISYDNFD